MKKTALFGMCLLATLGATAQTSLVKDVERQMKSAPDKYPTNLQNLTPAFTDPESADQPYVWFVAGKGGMEFFDNQQGLKQIGREVKDSEMNHALINSYQYLTNALRRDSIPDAKGKIKPKYSKDILKLINGHYNDFNNAAINLWSIADYNGAYEAWELFATIPNDPVLNGNGPKMPADSTLSDIYYNQALAAWQAERLEDALNSFDKSLAKGYNKKNLFDYAISVAYSLQDNARMAHYANLAYPLYGSEDNRYIGYIVNEKIANNRFDEAQELLENYIAADPTNSQLYYVLGILYDSQEDFENAKANYAKAIELNPVDAKALMQYGRQICNDAYKLDDAAQQMSTADYNRIRAEEVNPTFLKAVPYLEKAYKLNPDECSEALRFLRNIYYNLNDEENLHRIEDMM